AIDIAGSSAVHVVGGVSGLVATIYLKPRSGIFQGDRNGEKLNQMASPTNVLLGTFMLWWGWLGFNCGSTFGISGEKWKLAARSAVCTINGSIGGGIAGMFYSYIFYKNKLNVQIFVTGLLGGLVGVTAICAITRPSYALVIGAIGSLVACTSCKILERLRIDDPVGCVPVHLCSGAWSLIAVAFFLEKDKSGKFSSHYVMVHNGRWNLLGAQVALTIASCLWSACVTLILLASINLVVPIRMSLEDELKGSDRCEHGIILPGTFENTTEHSAYGTRTFSRKDWENQNSSNQAGTSNSSASGPGSTASDMTNEHECENGGDLEIHRSRLCISEEPKLSIVADNDNQQTNGQSNVGFNTDF
ncbi:ammonium transporter 3, partial [Paramuricea clavata]